MDCKDTTLKLQELAERTKPALMALNKMEARGISDDYLADLRRDVDKAGELIAPDRLALREKLARQHGFEFVSEVYEGKVAWGKANNRYILIDTKTGHLVSGPFIQATNFFRGAAIVLTSTHIWMIDTQGVTISDKYDRNKYDFERPILENYDGETIRVCDASGGSTRFNFLNHLGKIILSGNRSFGEVAFREGVAWLTDRQPNVEPRLVLVEAGDENHEVLFSLSENEYRVGPFSEYHDGFALILTPFGEQYEVVFIDKDGQQNPTGIIVSSESEVSYRGEGWYAGYISEDLEAPTEAFIFNKEGKKINLDFEYIRDVSEGIVHGGKYISAEPEIGGELLGDELAETFGEDEEQHYFYNIETGQTFGPYGNTGGFSEGFCAVSTFPIDDWYYIDRNGQPVIGRLEDASNFHEGRAAVKWHSEDIFGDWFFIDQKGKRMTEKYDLVGHFQHGVAKVKKGAEEFYINRWGRKIFSS